MTSRTKSRLGRVALMVAAVALSPVLWGTPSARAASADWERIMDDALARTALMPSVQAPSAWAVIEPAGMSGEGHLEGFTTTTGGGRGAEADTPFLAGSLSKPLTAAVVMRLVDRGALRVDAPVRDYLSGFRSQDAEPVTIAQLLSHTSGLRAQAGWDLARDPALSIAERAASASHGPLARGATEGETGSVFAYANLNYAILGAVVEAVSEEPFAVHVGRELFEPLGMRGSSADPDVAVRVAAGGHQLVFGVPVVHHETVPRGAAPDGYTVSTAADLAAFARMLLRGGLADDGARVLSEAAVRMMLAQHVSAIGAAAPGTTGYGFGWGTGGSVEHPNAAHVGRTEGFFAHVYLRPSDAQAVVAWQAAGGPLYDQTGPVRVAAAVLEGGGGAGPAAESGAMTAGIFAAFGAGVFGAMAGVGWLRRRRDRVRPARTPAAATRRMVVRVASDATVAIAAVGFWSLAAGVILTGEPTLVADPRVLSVELTLIFWLLGLALLARAAVTGVRGWGPPPR